MACSGRTTLTSKLACARKASTTFSCPEPELRGPLANGNQARHGRLSSLVSPIGLLGLRPLFKCFTSLLYEPAKSAPGDSCFRKPTARLRRGRSEEHTSELQSR